MSWKLIADRKMNQDYVGRASSCSYSFSLGPDQMPTTKWSAQKIVSAHQQSLEDQGHELLELRMWEDTSPTWETNYYVEMVATDSGGSLSSITGQISFDPVTWIIIISAALILLTIAFVVYFTIDRTGEIVEYVGSTAGGVAIPLMALAGVALGTALLIYVIRRNKKET